MAAGPQPQHARRIADLAPHIALPGQSSTTRLLPAWCISTTPESGEAVQRQVLRLLEAFTLKYLLHLLLLCFSGVGERYSLLRGIWTYFSISKINGVFLLKKKKKEHNNRTKEGHANANGKLLLCDFSVTNSRRQICDRECGLYL